MRLNILLNSGGNLLLNSGEQILLNTQFRAFIDSIELSKTVNAIEPSIKTTNAHELNKTVNAISVD